MPAITPLTQARLNFMDWLSAVRFHDYIFQVKERQDCLYLQAMFQAPDYRHGGETIQYTRQWMLHPDMTLSEFIGTVFKCALTSVEHEARESFTYRGKAIFGPHYDVEKLHSLCAQGDAALEHRPVKRVEVSSWG
jgi:hypothetical protein